MSDTYICPPILRYCKRGHPRTEETTFERKVRTSGKLYIVRECRICHSMRNSPHATGRKNDSKWLRFIESQPA
jgi:hypothetical protein